LSETINTGTKVQGAIAAASSFFGGGGNSLQRGSRGVSAVSVSGSNSRVVALVSDLSRKKRASKSSVLWLESRYLDKIQGPGRDLTIIARNSTGD
jgi:hypothetical protein